MSDFTLGGYMATHDRAAAFSGQDGGAYSVAVYVEDEPDERGRYAASLLFLRWSPGGERVTGHLHTPPLAWGATRDEASDRLGGWSLYDVKQALDEMIAAAPPDGW